MKTPAQPIRRPPLKTDDVRKLLQSIDDLFEGDADLTVLDVEGYKEVAAAVGHEPPKKASNTTRCTVCNTVFAHEPVMGEFCSTACEDWAFDHPDQPPYAPKGGK